MTQFPSVSCLFASAPRVGLSLEEIDLRTVKSVCDAGLCAMADGSAR